LKKTAIWMVGLLVAADLAAATVVLKGGKRLEVASYVVGGSFVVVQYAGGRRESYPLAMVDLTATKVANGEKSPAPAVAEEQGPHSPFLAARSSGKPRGPVVTDADVKHLEASESGEAPAKEEPKAGSDEAQLVLLGYDRKKVGDKDWEITARIANQGKAAASNVVAAVRVVDASGKAVATGSGSLPGRLEPGKEGAISVQVSIDFEPSQFACDLSWQKIAQGPTSATTGPAESPAAGAAAAPRPTPIPPAFSIPKGASPNTLVYNPMGQAPPGVAPQVPPPPPPKPQ